MRIRSAVFLTILILLSPAVLYALPSVSAIHGTWGFTFLTHNNDGTWESEGGRLVIKADGTGTLDNFYDDNGMVSSHLNSAFTYAAAVNGNGTITFTILTPESSISRLIVNDTADMIFLDGTRDLSKQKIGILIRLKETGYALTDFKGDYNALGYEFLTSPLITSRRTSVMHMNANGSGTVTGSLYTNDNGALVPPPPSPFASSYTFLTYGSPFLTFNPGPDVGSVNTDGNVFVMTQRGGTPPLNFRFGFYLGLKRESRTYTNADLAGKWITVGFAANKDGTFFLTLVRAMHCDLAGTCDSAVKAQVNGLVDYHSSNLAFSIASDGTFGQTFGSNYPPYAGVLANNGNTLYFNPSFDPIPGAWLEIGLRCADCAIPMETYLPLILR